MSIRPRHFRIVFAIVVIAALSAAAGAAIALVTNVVTGRASPLPTIPPWEWSGTDIAQWFSNRATSDSVVTVVTQVFATIAWLALIYVAWNVIRELIDQASHGVIDTQAPRTRQRSSSRRARPAFASSFVAVLLGASTLTASTVGAVGLPERAPAVARHRRRRSIHRRRSDHRTLIEVDADTALPAGMTWADHAVTRADESLRSIAADASGDASLARFIWTANQHREVAPGTALNDPTIVKQGWTLRIPVPLGSPNALPVITPTAETPAPDSHDEHVERGDNLYAMIDEVIDDPVTPTHVEAVALENDGVTTPDGTFTFSASNPDLIHPGQVFDLQPAINLATPTPGIDPVVDELPPPAATDAVETPTEAPPIYEAPTANETTADNPSTDVNGGGVAADAPAADPVVEATPVVADIAVPAPAVPAPAPPTPIPTNAVDVPRAQPGDSAATPPQPATAATVDIDQGGIPIMLLAAGGLGLAGLFMALDRRRRIARAKRPLGRAIAAPDPAVQRDEQIMRAAAHIDRATRVNLAVRQLGAQLAERDGPLRSRYILADSTTVTVVFDRHVELNNGWVAGTVPNS